MRGASVQLSGSQVEMKRNAAICSLIKRRNANDPDSSCRLKTQRGRRRGRDGLLCGGRLGGLKPLLTIFNMQQSKRNEIFAKQL